MDVLARAAEPDDVEPLRRLRADAAGEIEQARGGRLLLQVPPKGGAPSSRTAPRFTAVATIDGVVVGYLDAGLHELEDGSVLCRVDSVYVEPPARAVGAGEALVELLSSWARAGGAVGIDAVALPGARETKNFFESHGFSARLLVMHHDLTRS